MCKCADDANIIKSFNKIDKLSGPFEVPNDTILISAKDNNGIDLLKEKIKNTLFNN